MGRDTEKRVRQNPIMHEVRKADFGLSVQRKARQGEEPAAQAVTGDESLNFFVGAARGKNLGLSVQRKARQGEEPTAYAVTGDESNPFPARKAETTLTGGFCFL